MELHAVVPTTRGSLCDKVDLGRGRPTNREGKRLPADLLHSSDRRRRSWRCSGAGRRIGPTWAAGISRKRRYEPGAWLGGRIFPRRSDLSPDGRFLCYFAHKPSATWEHGEAYVALSKLPWLTALHAFSTCGTWTRGYYFTEDEDCENPEDAKLPIPYGLRSIPVVQFANERRRGWEEATDSPQRDPDGRMG